MSLAVVKRTVWPRANACSAIFFRIMVLPTPLGPTSTVLWPVLTKERLNSSSMASRSIFFGHAQSKSAIGLAAPTWASRARRSKPLAEDSSADQLNQTFEQVGVPTSQGWGSSLHLETPGR